MTPPEPFPSGTRLGGITILARLDHGYRVHYHCCGKLATLSNSQLKARRARPAMMCHACAASGARKPTPAFLQVDELPRQVRDRVPSATFLLAMYARAEAAVRRRTGG